MGNVLSKFYMNGKRFFHEKKRKSVDDNFPQNTRVRSFRMQGEFGPKKFIKP
jgi:hypothetical protein